MKRITPSRPAMVAGDPCWLVDGVAYRGFECRGVVFIKTAGTSAWLEFHGDDDNFSAGGVFVTGAGREKVAFNFLPLGQLERLATAPSLWFGAVNRARVKQGRTAVTAYSHGAAVLCPELRFEGVVRSVTCVPPVLGAPEPLNAWIECGGRVELL